MVHCFKLYVFKITTLCVTMSVLHLMLFLGTYTIRGQLIFEQGWGMPPPAHPNVSWDPQLDNLTIPTNPLSASWNSPIGSRYKEEAMELVATVCESDRLCKTQKPNIDLCGPCELCYCDDACVTYGDCCLDKLLNDVIGNVTIGDAPSVLAESRHSSCFDIRVRDHWRGDEMKHKLVSSCPHSYTQNPDVIKTCVAGSETFYTADAKISVDDLWNIWPIMSKKTLISYRNRACAECHDDHEDGDMVYWGLEVSCQESAIMPSGLTRNQVLQYILDKGECLINFRKPDQAMERYCIHDPEQHRRAVSVCNATGERKEFDGVLWKLCESFPDYTVKRSNTVYANVFCLMCQENITLKWKRFCGEVKGTFNFFFMISPSAIRRVVSDGEKMLTCACHDDEALDPVSNTCRQVLCPQGYDLSRDENSNFRCVDDGTLAEGLTYSINLELTSQNSSVSYSDVSNHPAFREILLKIQTELFKKLEPQVTMFDTRINQMMAFLYPPDCHPSTNNVTIGLSAKLYLMRVQAVSQTASKFESLLNSEWNIHAKTIGVQLNFMSKITAAPDGEMVKFALDQSNVVIRYPVHGCDTFFTVLNIESTYTKPVDVYSKVKNTLSCPYFNIGDDFNKYFTTYIDTEYTPVLKDEYILRFNTTSSDPGLNLSLIDFDILSSSGGEKSIIVCVGAILKYWDEMKKNGDKVVSFGKGLELASLICLTVSCVCLTITLVTFVIFPSLRTLPGKNTMALVSNMLMTMVMCLVTPFFKTKTVTCQIVGVVNHFFLLSSVTWLVICTYRMYRIFSRIFDHSRGQNSKSSRCFIKYLTVSITIPTTIIAITILSNHLISSNTDSNDRPMKSSQLSKNNSEMFDSQSSQETNKYNNQPMATHDIKSCGSDESRLTPIGYGDGVCYISNELSVLLAAATPIILAVLTNCVFFCLTMRSMRKMTSDQKTLGKEPRQQMVIYIKLCALTGLNWLPGLLAAVIDSEIVWYMFVILAGLQGLYVLIAFVCNSRVMNLYKDKFGCKRSKSDQKSTKDTTLTNTNSTGRRDESTIHSISKHDDVMIDSQNTLTGPLVESELKNKQLGFTAM